MTPPRRTLVAALATLATLASAAVTSLPAAGAPALTVSARPAASAQSVVIRSADTVSTVVEAAPDYATTVFSDPWDYSNSDDIHVQMPPEGNARVAGGFFTFDAAATYPWFDPLPYFPGSLAQEKDGPTHPIDADYYARVSFSMYSSQAGWGGINWSVCDWSKNAACSGHMGFPTFAGWHLYNLTPKTDQPTLPAAWSGKVMSLRIIPIAAKPGTHLVVDWLRAYHPQDPVTFAVPVPTPGQRVNIMWRGTGDQPTGGTLTTIATSGGTADVSFDYSQFPPGDYSLFAVGPGRQVGAPTLALRVLRPPTPVIDSPTAAGAGDFATQSIGHPWDFSSMASVGRHANVAGLSIQPGGILRGQNAGPEIDNPYLFLPTNRWIDGNSWHHLTVRVRYDGPFGITGGATGGAVGRLIWYDASDAGRSDQNAAPLILYPGWNTITVDLATNPPSSITDPTQRGARIGWASQAITSLRWDPNEDLSGRVWYIDSIRLAGDPVSYGGTNVAFHDPNVVAGETVTAYLTTSRFGTDNVGSSYTVPVAAGTNNLHVFSVHGLGGRLCWVRMVVNSPNGTATQWSSGPVRIVS
jgi:hypothetical protein